MSARGHRDELIGLAVLVVLTAVIMGVVAFLGTADGDPSDAAPDETPGAGATATEQASQGASEEPTARPDPEPEAGDQPSLYACRLVTREDAQRIFGPFGPDARVRQTYLGRAPEAGEDTAPATRVPGGVTTSCVYAFGDPAGHTLEVDLTQFGSARALERRWSRLTSQGRPVPRTDGMMASRPDHRSFVLRGDDYLVEARYSTFGDLTRTGALSPRERTWQQPRMRQVREAVSGHVADGTATEGLRPVNADLGPSVAGTPYVAPCAILTDAAVEATGGGTPGPAYVDSSYLPHDPYTDAPVASCERRGTLPRARARQARTTFVVLEVRVAADPAAAEEVQAKHLDHRYPRGTKIDEVTTRAGAAYVVDLGGNAAWPWRTRAIHVVVGPYELHLSVLRDVTEGRPYGRWVSTAELVAAANQLVDAMESGSGTNTESPTESPTE